MKSEFSGAALAEIMERLQISNVALAKTLGVHEMTVSNWRRGHNIPQQGNVTALADALGVAEVELLTGAGPMVFYNEPYQAERDHCTCTHRKALHSARIPATCSQCNCTLFRSVYERQKDRREQDFWDGVGVQDF